MRASLLLLLLLPLLTGAAQSQSAESRLIRRLLRSYNRNARPVRDSSDAVPVSLQLNMLRVGSIEDEQLRIDAWMNTAWQDEYLRWDPSDYEGLKSVPLPADSVWLPDVVPYTTGKATQISLNSRVVASHDGSVIFVPHVRTWIDCSSTGRFGRRCSASIGSWVHNNQQLNLTLQGDKGINFDNFVASGRWRVAAFDGVRVVSYYPCCTEGYVKLKYRFELRDRESEGVMSPPSDASDGVMPPPSDAYGRVMSPP